MSANKIRIITGKAVYLPGNDIDTDRIVPARFLKMVSFAGLGDALFFDERFDENGERKHHPLNKPCHQGARILLTGRNFGCGSSREHAPQSLVRAGFQAIVAESFAEIFFGNALCLGLMCVSVTGAKASSIAKRIDENPDIDVSVDLLRKHIVVGDDRHGLTISDSARDALLNGEWDPLGSLRDRFAAAQDVYERLPYLVWQEEF